MTHKPPPADRVYSTIVNSHQAVLALGEPKHMVQVQAYARVPSMAAFVRALLAAKLIYGKEPTVAAYIREWTGSEPTGNQQMIQIAQETGQVYVTSVNFRSTSAHLPWPLKEEHHDED